MQQMYKLAAWAGRRRSAEAGAAVPSIQWSFTAWVNLPHADDSQSAHAHPGATWSGAYDVDPGVSAPDEGAPLRLIDPCRGRAKAFLPLLCPSTVQVPPKAGLMALLPSHSGHSVFRDKGSGSVASIAFNLRSEPHR